MFAITHGLLVSYLADQVDSGHGAFKILGDDIVIRDDRLASRYQETLEDLGVPISKAKTMKSKTTFEFAKRWFHHGIEVSPFPVNALHEHLLSPLGLAETFRNAFGKGWIFPRTGVGPGTVANLLSRHNINKAFARKIVNRYEISASFPRVGDSHDMFMEKSVKFLRLHGVYVSCTS